MSDAFNGAAAWARLSPEQQAAIGAIALELAAAFALAEDWTDDAAEQRIAEAAMARLSDGLYETATDAVPALLGEDLAPPSMLGPICFECGCTEHDACEDGCFWVAPNLCSACRDKQPVG